LRFEVWVHALRFEDLSDPSTTGPLGTRRSLELTGGELGFAEERPGRIAIEITCTGHAYDTLGEICAAIPPAVLIALETMPDPILAGLPDGSVVFRFGDRTSALGSAMTSRPAIGDATYFSAAMEFHLEGHLHVAVARRGGLVRPPDASRSTDSARAIRVRIVPNTAAGPATDEHVLLTNNGRAPVQLEGYLLQDQARRTVRFAFPAFTLHPGKDIRLWTRRGDDEAGNFFWGRVRSVWTAQGRTATLLDASGNRVAQSPSPE